MNRLRVPFRVVDGRIGTRFPAPVYATSGAAGVDLRACLDEPLAILPGASRMVGSGIAVDLDGTGLAAVLVPRSGLGARDGIVLGNLVGVIDSDYHGEILISVWNRGPNPVMVDPGMRVCQMVFVPVVQVELVEVESFGSDTVRGSGGFGHTGVG